MADAAQVGLEPVQHLLHTLVKIVEHRGQHGTVGHGSGGVWMMMLLMTMMLLMMMMMMVVPVVTTVMMMMMLMMATVRRRRRRGRRRKRRRIYRPLESDHRKQSVCADWRCSDSPVCLVAKVKEMSNDANTSQVVTHAFIFMTYKKNLNILLLAKILMVD